MNRSDFVGLLVAAAGSRFSGRGGDDSSDPAIVSRTESLRVLLGRGDASRVDARTFIFNGRRYRGAYAAVDGQIISTVPLEEYLYSVVPREMPRSWPAAALQAQAILARTYVLAVSNPARGYDLVPSEADQVYTGMDAEHMETTAAVDATAGTVLRCGDGFAKAVYSSCCGGHTESATQAWGGQDLAYLNGVVCQFCNDSPWFSWKQNVWLDQLAAALDRQLHGLGGIQNITLDQPDPSGRAQYWTFIGVQGTQRVKASDVRRAVGTRTLPSLLVRRLQFSDENPQTARAVIIEGAGLGHGVGFCQWGGRGLARGGANVGAILQYYYPGTSMAHV